MFLFVSVPAFLRTPARPPALPEAPAGPRPVPAPPARELSPAEHAVQRGMAWLDQNHPGWVGRVRPGQLIMHDAGCCVLAQAAGVDFDTACIRARLTHDEILGYGFHRTPEMTWFELQHAWGTAIQTRRAARAA